METILSPKLEGTVNLDTVFQEEALDFLCLFSSTSSILGAAKACDYASANGYLTDFANWRNHKIAQKQRYGQTFSIHWPLWADGGMQGGVDYEVKARELLGIYPLPTKEGLIILDKLMGAELFSPVVFYGEQDKIARLLQYVQRISIESQKSLVNRY